MIRYQLLCENNHEFEAWFRDSAAFDEQSEQGEIQCPYCGNIDVRKAVMAPNLAVGKSVEPSQQQQIAINAAEQAAEDMRQGADPREVAEQFLNIVNKIQKHVEDTCEYVGDDFADEARAIHYGDAEERAIYGEATAEEREELLDEGIEVIAIPKVGDKKDAN